MQDCVRSDARDKCARGDGYELVDSSQSEELKMDEQSKRVTRSGALHFFAISAQSHKIKTPTPIELAFEDRVRKGTDS